VKKMLFARKLLEYIDKILLFASVASIVLASMIMAISVFWRDLLTISLVWAEEVTRYLTITAVFLLLGPLVRNGMHIRIVFLYVLLSRKVQKLLDAFVCCLGIFLCAACLVWSKDFIDLLVDVGARSISGTPLHPWTWQMPVIVGMGIGAISFLDELLRLLGVGGNQMEKAEESHSE
jgi:TRAP-type C4-dicarboxylate transport system permease small subunit